MEHSQPSSLDSEAMKSIREPYQQLDRVEQIDGLITFVEHQLQKMNAPSEAGSSSSHGWLETVRKSTEAAAKTIHTISKEALSSKNDAVKAMRSLTLKVMEGVEELQCVLIGLSVAAFAGESYMNVSSTQNECRLLLLKILQLAKDVKQYREQMPKERGKLSNAVAIIVQGAVICCDYMKGEGNIRFWSVTTGADQLKKTRRQLNDLRDSLKLPSLQRYWDKDVFLSHNGKQKNFVRQLHDDLKREGISCFFDEDPDSLPRAEIFPSLIFKAAETCKIAVLVLSKEFIRSNWPMLELAAFIRANRKLLPIFFKISPNKLNITIDSPEWKKWQKLGVDDDTRGEWQDALNRVRSINGEPLGEGDNEFALRKKVVREISCLLHGINRRPQLLDFQPVGIEDQVKKVMAKLDMEGPQPSLGVIICGFGGIGKTTLAYYVVESLDWSSIDFKFCWVVIDEKTLDRSSHIIKLQQDILYRLNGVRPALLNFNEGQVEIKKALARKSTLLLIDNVVGKGYVKDLLPKELPSGEQETKLRIIVTCREKSVEEEIQIECEEYEVETLCDEASKSLFSKTILKKGVVNDKDEEVMINKVALACKGVPLLLSLFGNHLRVKRRKSRYQKDSYQAALDVIKKGNFNRDLSETLMFVYDKIESEEVKEAFLDICKYFHGWKWNVVSDIVDSVTLEDLQERVLVSRSGSNEVNVHDILRVMGINKANFTRFSNYETLSNALNGGFDMKHLKGISLLNYNHNDNHLIRIKTTDLEAMSESLRVLMIGDWVTLEGPPCEKEFKNLRYLHLGDVAAFPFKDPSNLKFTVFVNKSKPGMNLSHLPLSLKRIYHEVHGISPFAMQEFIQDLGHMSSLESLILDGSSVQPSMKGYSNLTDLPRSVGRLHSLQTLEISEWIILQVLPESFGKLTLLKHIILINCYKLMSLPKSFVQLKKLETLEIINCALSVLPKGFGGLKCLKRMTVLKCSFLKELPRGFGKLKRLRFLHIQNCGELRTLSGDFENMATLEGLWIKNCPELDGAIMDKILKLQNCYVADISGSRKLAEKWEHMQGETEHPIVVYSGKHMRDSEQVRRIMRVALLDGKCMEVNNATNEIMERSSLLEEGTTATVALIMLPIHFSSHQHPQLRRYVEQARKKADEDGSGKLQIVCARKVDWYAETPTPTEEEKRAEKEGIRQILLSLEEGSCAIPSWEFKRVKILTCCCNSYKSRRCELFSFFMGNGGVDKADEISVSVLHLPEPPEMRKPENEEYDSIKFKYHTIRYNNNTSIQRFILCIGPWGPTRIQYIDLPRDVVERDEDEDVSETDGDGDVSETDGDVSDGDGDGHDEHENARGADEQSHSQCVGEENKTTEFIKELKANRIHHLLTHNATKEMRVDDLQGKAIGLVICHFECFLTCTNLQQIYDDFEKKDSNFIWIWIPTKWPEDCGHGSYTRFIQCMPWATLPHPLATLPLPLFNHKSNPYKTSIVILDKEGQIANRDASSLLMAWGVETYPFTQHTIPESFCLVESMSCLEFLLHGMNIARKSKMTFLYAEDPRRQLKMKSKLEELTQIPGSFEVLYVGNFHERVFRAYSSGWDCGDLEIFKNDYEDVTQNMRWPSLDFSDMITFWYRCFYLKEKSNMETLLGQVGSNMETLHVLATDLDRLALIDPLDLDERWGLAERGRLVLMGDGGVVTSGGYHVVQMICESWDEEGEGMAIRRMVKKELIESLGRGECSAIVRKFFRDVIDNHPQHPQHPLSLHSSPWNPRVMCGVCGVHFYTKDKEKRCYYCRDCEDKYEQWFMCWSCWMAYAKQQVEQLLPPEDN